ncbi:ricin-type beta-trefoil lectin domain protein [Streptomyces sp. RKAG290]|uniref:ricin-type beta-trefoil lectin domain protein n=1 Tax=Streptomyces sp. RKAG290 TaxID=2888348 RepID=UPI0035A84F86
MARPCAPRARAWPALKTAGSNGTLRALGKCLDATALGTANGTTAGLWDCRGETNEVWQAYNGGYRNPGSGRCLDDLSSSMTFGRPPWLPLAAAVTWPSRVFSRM